MDTLYFLYVEQLQLNQQNINLEVQFHAEVANLLIMQNTVPIMVKENIPVAINNKPMNIKQLQ